MSSKCVGAVLMAAVLLAFNGSSAAQVTPPETAPPSTAPSTETMPPAQPAPTQAPPPPPTYQPAPQPQVVMQAPVVPYAPPPPPDPVRSVSLTISPIHLLLPVVELTLEVALAEQVGIAFIGGYGATSIEVDGDSDSVAVYELGGSFRYYATGNFNGGLQVGAELLWVQVELEEGATSDSLTAVGTGLGIGPFVGYKYTSSIGFTFDGQAGVMYLTARGEASDGDASETTSVSTVGLLLNLNIGFSF